ALDRVRLEVLHMGEKVQAMLNRIMPAIISGSSESLDAVAQLDDEVDILYEQILDYLGRISKQSLSDNQTDELLSLMEAVGDLENIGDTIETNLVALGHERIKVGFSISEPTRIVLQEFHRVIVRSVDGAIQSVSQINTEVAHAVVAMKDEITALASSATQHQAARLVAEEPNRIAAYTTEVDIIEKQKRIYYFAKRMAKTVLTPEEAEEAEESEVAEE
ncbi:MAG: PhoU domain-containing protein, partial [Candidatus Thiodiazotropha sp. 6PLUC3]